MTSSLRNSIHRRNHKERAQLAHRKKLGILEKHKDYVKRARDYHSKQDRITRLRQKAAERNKDEFYFAMNKEKTRRGVHVKDRGNVALPTDIVKVLKTQDENYVRTARSSGKKKIDKIKSQLMALADLVKPGSNEDQLENEELATLQNAGIISSPPKKKSKKSTGHIVFVDDDEEARKYVESSSTSATQSRSDKKDDNEPVDLGWKPPATKPKKRRRAQLPEQGEDHDAEDSTSEETQELARSHRSKLIRELGARLKRDKMLGYTQREFEMQRLMMGKGAKQKIVGTEKVEDGDSDEDDDRPRRKTPVDEATYKPRVYKWRRERKR
ncbi:hypothetical protein ONZ45_g12565 [Pleurotus djamor]|nr:hypothetical protein ONZ45_g12565 [Pleurotus djamor]